MSAMNGYCKTLDCFFGAQFDPDTNEWIAIQVYRDGNKIELCRFITAEEAEECAATECGKQLQAHGQFGVGA